ncbi:MAG: NUDIX domain-containing protein [Candidatus Dormibacteraeota bacterium]|nr:NUDIX domain-containing protein [Candidatus Dormibacteraeota bacterium]MBV8445670.1 NUDIX domain-containing protein [Candidatus Dormibacteraeota bacterium]
MPRDFRPSEVSAGGVVVRRAGDAVDVCLVSDGRHWGLPKGNVERGESAQTAALREIEEEVGLSAETLRIVAELAPAEYVYRRDGRLIFKRVHQFLVEAPPDALLHADGFEIVEAAWLTEADAVQRASFADTKRAIDAALHRLDGATEPGP